MTEIRAIPGFPGYGVSADGRAWTHKSPYGIWREMKQHVAGSHSKSRTCVKLHVDGKGHTKYVGSLVLEVFVGPRPEGAEAQHLNGDWMDCRLENLRWGFRDDNLRSGWMQRSLSDRAVRNIRYLLEQKRSQSEIARQYGVNRQVITGIKLGTTYKGVK